jgi:hypothetical protein
MQKVVCNTQPSSNNASPIGSPIFYNRSDSPEEVIDRRFFKKRNLISNKPTTAFNNDLHDYADFKYK